MKAVMVLILLVGAGVVGFYYVGGYAGHSPKQQGLDAKAAITPGMTWQQVLAVSKPIEYCAMKLEEIDDGFGGTIEVIRPTVEVRYKPERFAQRVNNGDFPHGFKFFYRYSSSVAFTVSFDENLTVSGKEDLVTMHTLLGDDGE